MSNQFKYYRLFPTNEPDIPTIKEKTSTDYLYLGRKIDNPELMIFDFSGPSPIHPNMVDYLSSPRDVFSQKVYDVLSPMNIKSIQLMEAVIEDGNGKEYKDYWGLNIIQRLTCIDRELSKCSFKSFGLAKIKKLVLDRKVLIEIPLEERLIFRVKEHPYALFHVSIVKAIQAVNPTGMRFIDFEKFDDGSYMREG